jgi:hypothetical protein
MQTVTTIVEMEPFVLKATGQTSHIPLPLNQRHLDVEVTTPQQPRGQGQPRQTCPQNKDPLFHLSPLETTPKATSLRDLESPAALATQVFTMSLL